MSEVVTMLGVLATAIIGIANLSATNRRIKIDGVTQHRTQWIAAVRDITSTIVSYDSREIENEKDLVEKNNQLLNNAYVLSLHLNVQGSFDRVVSDYLINFVKAQRRELSQRAEEIQNDFVYNRRMLNFSVQIYLKVEWNRVKWENSWRNIFPYKEKKQVEKILKKFDQENTYVKELQEKHKKYTEKENRLDAPVFVEYLTLGSLENEIDLSSSAASAFVDHK